jgi:hypothetical protein
MCCMHGVKSMGPAAKASCAREITANEHRESTRKASKYGCKQCDVTLC